MLVGYARVSTQDQNPALQLDALNRAAAIVGKRLRLELVDEPS